MESTKNYKGLYILGAAVLVILLFLVLCFRTVGAGQVGIVTRFGAVNRTANSGIALKLPWPMERLIKMDTRVQKEQQQSAAATTDLQDVNATLALNYALDGQTAIKIYKEVGTDYKERIIVPTLQESFKAASANYTASQLVTERTAVKGKAYDVIKSRLGKYGIRVVDLNIVNFNFSPAFTKAIEDKQVAQQLVEKVRFDTQRVQQEAQSAIAQAQGQAEAQRLQQQTLTPEYLQLKAIEKWNGTMPNAVGGNSIFNIPLTR